MSDNPVATMIGGKRLYFRPTTADQRKLMFAVYEQTDSPRNACMAAHVGLGTFYHWVRREVVDGIVLHGVSRDKTCCPISSTLGGDAARQRAV